MNDMLKSNLLLELEQSGKVRSLELLRSDIKNYNKLKKELDILDYEYAQEVMKRREIIDESDEEIHKIKSPGYGDGLGGYVEPLDKKINRLTEKKRIAEQELKTFYSSSNTSYYNKKWVLMSRVAYIEDVLSRLDENDRQFIYDLYIEPIGFRNVMQKYSIENNGDIYRKASNILRKLL